MHDRPVMNPGPGARLMRFVGDRVRFSLTGPGGMPLPRGYQARLRTNLGRASVLHEEIVRSYAGDLPIAGASWRDIPMTEVNGEWVLDMPLVEVGFFKAKAYAINEAGRQFWPDGPDVGVTVHPNYFRTGNTIYCAFIRMFGETKTAVTTRDERSEAELSKLDQKGYTVIPPSGKFRDLIAELPHIMDTLGCRILHLLPVHPTPTTYARFGRFGSPYAAQDLGSVDLAMAEFDRRATGLDQFRELTYAVHLKGGRVFLDMVINHTGWGSTLQEHRPEWFLRDSRGNFISPGAWGVVWEDLVELDHRNTAPWAHLADAFLTWCRRGIDGFRCDAGYKVPMAAWRYIIARVRQEFPETIFLLEGLGGPWETTELLLTEGGMQWAYSELFQNYSGSDVARYLDYALGQSERVGVYIHYSETHDNDRLAKRGRAWSLLRNRLAALTSVSGGYGFTCGVEWLATEKINVHSSTGLSWGGEENIVRELADLNALLKEHPCFFDHANLTRLSTPDSPVYALHRISAEGLDQVLVLVNTDVEHPHDFILDRKTYEQIEEPKWNLLDQAPFPLRVLPDRDVVFELPAGACVCLAPALRPRGLSGEAYRLARAQSGWAFSALKESLPAEWIGPGSWREVAGLVERDLIGFLAAIRHLDPARAVRDLGDAFRSAMEREHYPPVVRWGRLDLRRITPVPPDHWLLVEDDVRFRAALSLPQGAGRLTMDSVQFGSMHAVIFPPRDVAGEARLDIERYGLGEIYLTGALRYLPREPRLQLRWGVETDFTRRLESSAILLLTNGIGGMARLGIDLGRIQSKYDCLLGANLHPSVPVDRHVFAKRMRVWVNADGFLSPLDRHNLIEFEPGPPSLWRFVANAGDGRAVEISLQAVMLEGSNATVLQFERPEKAPPFGKDLPEECDVRLTVRIDMEDRNFHWETRRNAEADHHFAAHTQALTDQPGFQFTPAPDRRFRVVASSGWYHPAPEWSEGIPHPVEQSRGQAWSGDAYSPGWFELPLPKGGDVVLIATAEPHIPSWEELRDAISHAAGPSNRRVERAGLPEEDLFGRQLARAVQAFVVRRGSGKTVIAGYPWFLDWGRDSLICCRGMLAAGMLDEVVQLLITFGRFEEAGTLPNSIHGEDASNRDTSDAPLWYAVVCEEAAPLLGMRLEEIRIEQADRTLADVLRSIALGYLRGTPNGIRVDPDSGLVWSPSHFTWMDTNHPAGTPRAGFPVEIQALWIRLLRLLAREGIEGADWGRLARQAESSFLDLFWLEDDGWLSDCLFLGHPGPAASAVRDRSLRSNGLFAVSFGLLSGARARRCVAAAARYLVVPGALRTLAPLPVDPPLPIIGADGRLLNDPVNPYRGRYEGDEDTQRKPAYHNGTAWTWTYPTFCEALAVAWDFEPAAVAAARAYLAGMARLLGEGCVGHLPEILDGDAPHTQRGCDAQAWSATEALRVWKSLSKTTSKGRR